MEPFNSPFISRTLYKRMPVAALRALVVVWTPLRAHGRGSSISPSQPIARVMSVARKWSCQLVLCLIKVHRGDLTKSYTYVHVAWHGGHCCDRRCIVGQAEPRYHQLGIYRAHKSDLQSIPPSPPSYSSCVCLVFVRLLRRSCAGWSMEPSTFTRMPRVN